MIRNHKDFFSGALFFIAGSVFLGFAPLYGLGSLDSMEAGSLPMVLGGGLGAIGLITMFISLRGPRVAVHRLALLPMGLVSLSVVTFGLLAEWAGAAIAIFVVAFVASLAGQEFTWLSRLALSLALTVISLAIFLWGLGMPIPVFGRFFL